jgi:hypothetical protein
MRVSDERCRRAGGGLTRFSARFERLASTGAASAASAEADSSASSTSSTSSCPGASSVNLRNRRLCACKSGHYGASKSGRETTDVRGCVHVYHFRVFEQLSGADDAGFHLGLEGDEVDGVPERLGQGHGCLFALGVARVLVLVLYVAGIFRVLVAFGSVRIAELRDIVGIRALLYGP